MCLQARSTITTERTGTRASHCGNRAIRPQATDPAIQIICNPCTSVWCYCNACWIIQHRLPRITAIPAESRHPRARHRVDALALRRRHSRAARRCRPLHPRRGARPPASPSSHHCAAPTPLRPLREHTTLCHAGTPNPGWRFGVRRYASVSRALSLESGLSSPKFELWRRTHDGCCLVQETCGLVTVAASSTTSTAIDCFPRDFALRPSRARAAPPNCSPTTRHARGGGGRRWGCATAVPRGPPASPPWGRPYSLASPPPSSPAHPTASPTLSIGGTPAWSRTAHWRHAYSAGVVAQYATRSWSSHPHLVKLPACASTCARAAHSAARWHHCGHAPDNQTLWHATRAPRKHHDRASRDVRVGGGGGSGRASRVSAGRRNGAHCVARQAQDNLNEHVAGQLVHLAGSDKWPGICN
jgi:hypothetical protein